MKSKNTNKLLYIHIPFCDSKCNYCAFNSYTNINHLKKEYFNAIKKQYLHDTDSNIQFETVFIGGGTPSTMPVNFYENLFTLIEENIKNAKEITIEANPNVTYEWLKEIKNLGINRISFGVQSFNEKKLKFLNRNHSPTQAIKSIENAKKTGFENINLDLIYATALDNKKLLENDLKIAFNLPITHISAYSLTIEEGTKWEGDYSKRKEDEILEIWFIDKIKERFFHYEISNFGKICLHNLGYWEGKEYTGLGAGAVGFKKLKIKNGKWKIFRYYTQNSVYEYLKNPTKYNYEYLSDEDIKKEKIFLGLRSIVGFDEKILNIKEKERTETLINEKKLYKKENKIYSNDFLLADALTKFIIS
ncbi:oxygen-independent coproporphyrinogen III oxidase [Lebetimonas natsushimae]|uniref:Heme chaperone HemW n=1 Tax=Lebetimonas natsushimae TaxID=1936991 RepID=A0A292YDS6_9BACT|nr:radical SAM family heme chaperone HemW [Lebetimonas natsushimae]GAX87344.1 oxygen-independent coproporphyrinogen III oxidase [Lebetimonas natsushimae]